MQRRNFIKKSAILAGGVTLASSTLGANINKNKKVKIKLATSWPANFPIMGTGIDRFAKRLKIISSGSLKLNNHHLKMVG